MEPAMAEIVVRASALSIKIARKVEQNLKFGSDSSAPVVASFWITQRRVIDAAAGSSGKMTAARANFSIPTGAIPEILV
jgi:hypothetical protein